MTKSEAKILQDLAGSVLVVRNQQLETNRILKMLTGVLGDLQSTAEGLRQELAHVRTARERTERAAILAEAVDHTVPEPT